MRLDSSKHELEMPHKELLGSYSGLFIERCTVCERVLSAEGHIPPVVRIWTLDDKDGNGKWEPRHITCSRV
jgi:hypothetical protein